jgi:hypothetical protein
LAHLGPVAFERKILGVVGGSQPFGLLPDGLAEQ